MKRDSSGQKHQKARPRSRRFARVCNAVQRGGPRSQMMLLSMHSQAPITKSTSNRGRPKPVMQ
eukprot:1797196-Pleurochrysis_carterae.AAC.1